MGVGVHIIIGEEGCRDKVGPCVAGVYNRKWSGNSNNLRPSESHCNHITFP